MLAQTLVIDTTFHNEVTPSILYSTQEVHETEPPFHNEYRLQDINFYTGYVLEELWYHIFTMKLNPVLSRYSTQEVHETEPPFHYEYRLQGKNFYTGY